MTLYEKLAETASGARALAAARLRYRVMGVLHDALESSGQSQAAVAKNLGVRRSAANQVFRSDGNLRVNTIAEYLDAMGFELSVQAVPAGTARRKAQAWRELRPSRPAPWSAIEAFLATQQAANEGWLPPVTHLGAVVHAHKKEPSQLHYDAREFEVIPA